MALLTVLALAAPAAALAAEPAATLKEGSYARHLIDQQMARHPAIAVMAIHATPPGGQGNVIVASNIGRLGKPADADDLEVIRTGKPKMSVNKAGDHFEVLEPLKDVEGEVIGALGVVYHYKAGDDRPARIAEATQTRDQMARRIAHAGNLLDPWPYVPAASEHTFGQALVDKTIARHPEVIILALHATPPGSKTNVILGSNIGRIGKAADEDDLRVIEKGETNREVNENGRRFEAELPLNDAHGKRIGALGVVFRYHAGEDKEALVRRAEKIRDEMAREIASPAVIVRKS
jgi:hypothetical protein